MHTYTVFSVLDQVVTPRVVSFSSDPLQDEKFAIAGRREIRCYTVSRELVENGALVENDVLVENGFYVDEEVNMEFCAMTWGGNTKQAGRYRLYVIVGSENGCIRVLDSRDLTLVKTLHQMHHTEIRALSKSRRCEGLLLSASDECISVWSLDNFHCLRQMAVNQLLSADFHFHDIDHILSGHRDGYMVWLIEKRQRDQNWLRKRLKTRPLHQIFPQQELKSTGRVVMEMDNVGGLDLSVVALMRLPSQNLQRLTRYDFKRTGKGKKPKGAARFRLENNGMRLLPNASKFEVSSRRYYAVGDRDRIKIYDRDLQLTADIPGGGGRIVYSAISVNSRVVVGINEVGRVTVFLNPEGL